MGECYLPGHLLKAEEAVKEMYAPSPAAEMSSCSLILHCGCFCCSFKLIEISQDSFEMSCGDELNLMGMLISKEPQAACPLVKCFIKEQLSSCSQKCSRTQNPSVRVPAKLPELKQGPRLPQG